ncbi:MAG TPA: M28 family peptidase [Anaerolinea sp.]|nr:M28 family peptidase [Anaerolinea sp.]
MNHTPYRNRLKALLLTALLVFVVACTPNDKPLEFDGAQAYEHVKKQVDLGMRIPGTPAHADVIQYITSTLNQSGWSVEIQQAMDNGLEIQNLVATRDDSPPSVLLGAHYDTRQYADQDPDPQKRTQPVPGANDGASGVAVLLEIARVLPKSVTGVTLLFIDAEDQGDINGQAWIRGASLFVEDRYADPVSPRPSAAIIVDMVGDADLQLFYENNSDQKLREQIWSTADSLGYSGQFIARPKYTMIDDHIPFRNAGIPAVDIIDFDYPYWHTTADMSDKVSPQSLEAVGKTLVAWLKGYKP